MNENKHPALRWTLFMTGAGLATFGIVYLITANLGWALIALLLSGVVFNIVAQNLGLGPGDSRTPRHR